MEKKIKNRNSNTISHAIATLATTSFALLNKAKTQPQPWQLRDLFALALQKYCS